MILIWLPNLGMGASPATGSSLAAGTATLGTYGVHSANVSATAATGGTSPYTYQWQYEWAGNGLVWTNAIGVGVTTLSATIQGLGQITTYNFRLMVTDSTSNVAYSNTISGMTLIRKWYPGLQKRRA